MSDATKENTAAELAGRSASELMSQIVDGREVLRKARFKHATGQLRETHTLGQKRREIARLATALTRQSNKLEEKT